MRKILIISFLTLFSFIKGIAQQSSNADIANRISQKMSDSLGLTQLQKNQVYLINVHLASMKGAVRQQNLPADSVRIQLQKVENTRDSLYRPVLGEQKFLLYRAKKRFLISAQ